MSEENDKNLEESHIKSVGYGEVPTDIIMPDILIPPPQKDETKKVIEDEVNVAFKFAFLGAGQGGSRIAENFYKLGYRRVAVINTAQQDLNSINLENKLCFGEGGAGKAPEVATQAFQEKSEDISDFMRRSFGDNVDKIFVCAGAGGGTGAGSVISAVRSAVEIQANSETSKKVGVILALPKASEGKRVNANAANTLNEAYDLVDQGIVSPLILIDNEKIGQLYPNLVVSEFWNVANQSMAGLFHLFNHTAAKDSTYSSFDSNDYKQVLDSGLIVFGASPVSEWKDSVSIARAVRENLKNNLLSGGIDLSTGNSAAAIIIGGTEQLNNIPQSYLDQAFDQLSKMMRPNSVVHRGIYSGDKPSLNVFSAIGGLGRPEDKLSQLKKLGDLPQ
jgi:cell division GTPase FtsZ|tara:strand:- start:7583 stop:8752 length:1170 start_codon:yes stop_codon:yes gene_type:complete